MCRDTYNSRCSAHNDLSHGDCCCSVPGHGHTRFPAREENTALLGEYLKQLQAEVKTVEERLAELRREA